MTKQFLVHYQVDDGTTSGYEGVNRVEVTDTTENAIIGRAPETTYISGVRINKAKDTVELLKQSPSKGFYTETHELTMIETVK